MRNFVRRAGSQSAQIATLGGGLLVTTMAWVGQIVY